MEPPFVVETVAKNVSTSKGEEASDAEPEDVAEKKAAPDTPAKSAAKKKPEPQLVESRRPATSSTMCSRRAVRTTSSSDIKASAK